MVEISTFPSNNAFVLLGRSWRTVKLNKRNWMQIEAYIIHHRSGLILKSGSILKSLNSLYFLSDIHDMAKGSIYIVLWWTVKLNFFFIYKLMTDIYYLGRLKLLNSFTDRFHKRICRKLFIETKNIYCLKFDFCWTHIRVLCVYYRKIGIGLHWMFIKLH